MKKILRLPYIAVNVPSRAVAKGKVAGLSPEAIVVGGVSG